MRQGQVSMLLFQCRKQGLDLIYLENKPFKRYYPLLALKWWKTFSLHAAATLHVFISLSVSSRMLETPPPISNESLLRF